MLENNKRSETPLEGLERQKTTHIDGEHRFDEDRIRKERDETCKSKTPPLFRDYPEQHEQQKQLRESLAAERINRNASSNQNDNQVQNQHLEVTT